MKNNDNCLSYDEAKSILYKWEKREFYDIAPADWKKLLPTLGLATIHKDGCWLASVANISYIEVRNKKQWLISKIKYGI